MEHQLNANIMIVDDEGNLLKMMKTLLESEGFHNIFTAQNGEEAIQIVSKHTLNLILLDIMLPDINGFELYECISEIAKVPIIFVSARDEDTAKLRGLGLGADDYITKPFLPKELTLRVSAVLRRTYQETKGQVMIGKARFDVGVAAIVKDTITTTLTATEYKILIKLIENKGNIVTIDSLCASVWQDGDYGYENTLMVHIRRLREKIEEQPSKPVHLITVRGLGYRLLVGENV